MKIANSLLSLLLLLFAFLLSPSIVSSSFIRNSNPVIDSFNLPPWAKQIYAPVIILTDNSMLLLLSGSNQSSRQIGYSNSNNPYNWSILSDPLIAQNFISEENIGVEHPSIILTSQQQYKLWFNNVVLQFPNYNFNLYFTSSQNLVNWSSPKNLIFDKFTSWDSYSKTAPSVLFNTLLSKYQMWYTGNGNIGNEVRWRIGFATSEDGISWQKNSEPVLDADQPWENSGPHWGIGNPSVLLENNTFHMFYHADNDIGHATSTDGIHWTKDPNNPVFTHNSDPNAFDGYRVMDPYVLKWGDKYLMYYTGSDTHGKWQIGVAESDSLDSAVSTPTPSPTISPSITPTPSPTATVTPTPRDVSHDPVILIPGLGASWNPQAIFSCTLNSYGEWNLGPYVSLYERLLSTFTKKLSLKRNEDVYLYTYDWRLPLDTQGANLKEYIESVLRKKLSDIKVRLIGHSLGGLVIRSYLSNYPNDQKASIVVTVGTPHQGTILAYPLWENGEIWYDDFVVKIAITQLINHCRRVRLFSSAVSDFHRTRVESNRETLQTLIPSLRTLLPTFDFLKQDNSIIPIEKFFYTNNWLLTHQIPQDLPIALYTLSGNNISTLRYLNVTNPSRDDVYAGNWPDGYPTSQEKLSDGDGTVLGISSILPQAVNEVTTGDHREIIATDHAIETILRLLNLPDVEPDEKIPLELSANAALIISIPTAGKVTVEFGRQQFYSENQILTLYNPESGVYTATVVPFQTIQSVIELSYVTKDTPISTFLEKELFFRKNVPMKFTFELEMNGQLKLPTRLQQRS
ncbi:hypothetical protein HYW55_02815 [Candidatus Gottesmanbacteria bacterium]|nr:hypothetical protein [Candidatus Gottesmanbacteria bacterium]